MPPNVALDNLLGNMHDDEMIVIEEKLRAIERQVMIRRLESIALSATLIRQIDDLTQQIVKLEPNPGAPDVHLQTRVNLERELRDRQFQLQNEAVQRWRDTQPIQQERRQDQKTQREERQDYERMSGAFYDS